MSAALRVLIADDDRDAVMTLGILLRSEGYEVHLAQSGKEAMSAALEAKPDVALLDLQMPGFSGLRTAWPEASLPATWWNAVSTEVVRPW